MASRRSITRAGLATGLLITALLGHPGVAGAATTHQPDLLTDEFDADYGAGDLSLREAFFLAQQDGDDSVISLLPGATYALSCIGALEGPVAHNMGSEALLLEGAGATIEQTCPDHRVMTVSSAGFEIEDLTVTGGDATANGGGVFAIGPLTVTDSRIIGNTDQGTLDNGGGGILGQGDVTILRSLVAGNSARTGGAVATVAGGDIEIGESAVVDNTGTGTISGLDSAGDLTVANSTLSGNEGPSAVTQSAGDTTLRHATVAGNTATNVGFSGRIVYVLGDLGSSHSIVAGNEVSAGNCFVQGATASSYSVDGDTACAFTGVGDQQNVAEPRLGPARANGGELPSVFPLWDSPVVDAVPGPQCDGGLPADQRGVGRPHPAGGSCDIGAVEAVYPPHGFNDVPPWVDDAVAWITSSVNDPPMMTGITPTTFKPDDPITRAQVARLLYREAGAPDVGPLPAHGFNDVPPWVEDAVRWVKANGIMTGITPAAFVPNAPITRAQVVRAKYRLAGEPPVGALAPHGFNDVPPWVRDAVRWARGHDLVTGITPTTFKPDDSITRAQVTRVDYRLAINPDAWADPLTAPATLPFVADP